MLDLYVETAVHLEPPTIGSVVDLRLPSSSTDSLPSLSRFPPLQGSKSRLPSPAKDEASFVEQHLSSSSSIYFRQTRLYPRTFLWRVLESNKVLELRCSDLAKSEHELGEAYLTLRLHLQDHIIPGGVALSDVQGQDGLFIFIITSSKQLYTLSLASEFFKSAEASKNNIGIWCKTFVPSAFTIDTPHRIYAHNPFQLFVSFDSGRLQSLSRKPADDGSNWTQLSFDDKSWGASIRGMVKWSSNQLLEHNSRYFSPTTANAMIASSDATYLYTICLNHTLRVWNLTTGKLEVSKDLLNRIVRPQDPPTFLSPEVPSVLQLCDLEYLENPILLTFSPHHDGQFKFWEVRGGLIGPMTVEDMFPHLNLKPPDPDPSGNTIWSLAGFEVRPGSIHMPTELWLLWRNNNLYQLYSLHLDLQDPLDGWTNNWVKTNTCKDSHALPPDFVVNDSYSPTGKWVDFLFSPKRYPVSVLETALNIYRNAMRIKVAIPDRKKSLQERVCACIASSVNLRKFNEQELDFVRFALDTDTQWRNYWRTVEALNEKRKTPVSLAFDKYTDIAWVLQSDQCCAIRESNSLETVSHNSQDSLQHLETLTRSRWPHQIPLAKDSHTLQKINELLDVAGQFTQSFTPELSRECETALSVELSVETESSVSCRINDLYQQCDFDEAVSNEACEKVFAGIERLGGLQVIGKKIIPAVLSLLPEKVLGSHTALRSTIFGSAVLDAGLRDSIQFGRQIVYSLFFLVVFLESEVDQDSSESDPFDAATLFVDMLAILKEYEKKIWLMSHVRDVSMELVDPSIVSATDHDSKSPEPPQTLQLTLLRDTTGKDIKPQPAVGMTQSHLLSEMLHDIEAWVGGASEISPDDGCVWIQCNLLAHGEVAMANDFYRFQPNTPWSTYVKGRLHLAQGGYEQAALSFQQAAYPLAHGKAIGLLTDMSAGLLSLEDTDYFNNGISCYFQHILALYQTAKADSFVADFARMALTAMQHDHIEREANQDNVLASLFVAELHCSRFSSAYAALTRIANVQSKKRLTIVWLDAVLALDSSPRVLETTDIIELLQRLSLDFHPRIAQVVDDRLSKLAQNQASRPAASGQMLSQENRIDFLKVLYALRLGRQDYRGAVSVMMDKLQLVKKSRQARNDPRAAALRQTLLALINVMSCVAPDEAYILSSIAEQTHHTEGIIRDPDGRDIETGWKPRRRMIITLEDLRHEYQQLLDKCSRIERGDFDFDIGIDDDDEEEEQEVGEEVERS